MPQGFFANKRNIIIITLIFGIIALLLIVSVINPRRNSKNGQSTEPFNAVNISPLPDSAIKMDTAFEITFSKPVDFEKVYFTTSPYRDVVVSQGTDNKKVRIAPRGLWKAEEAVKMTILTTTQSEDKSNLAKEYSFNFTPQVGEIEIVRESSSSGRTN